MTPAMIYMGRANLATPYGWELNFSILGEDKLGKLFAVRGHRSLELPRVEKIWRLERKRPWWGESSCLVEWKAQMVVQ